MSEAVEVSVVIPLHDGIDFLPPLLESLEAQEWNGAWELVVADNGSSDGGPDLVKTYASRLPRVKVIEALNGSGSAYARNAGASEAGGSLLVFIDHDDVVGPGYVAAMVDALRTHRLVCGQWEVETLNPDWAHQLLPSGQRDGPMMWNYDFLPYAAGGTLAMRRELFDAIGGFAEDVAYADCTDLCWRAQLDAGAELAFVREAVVHYRYRSSAKAMFKQARNWGRAEVEMYARYRPRGLPRISVRRSLGNLGFLWHVRRLTHPAGRAWWATRAGNTLGRIEGSLRHRTLML